MQVDLSQRAVSTENDMNMGLKKESGKKMVFYRLKMLQQAKQKYLEAWAYTTIRQKVI